MAITLKELFEKLPDAFIPEKAEGLDVVIQFNLSGEEAGDWYVTVKDGTCVVGEGQHEDPFQLPGSNRPPGQAELLFNTQHDAAVKR